MAQNRMFALVPCLLRPPGNHEVGKVRYRNDVFNTLRQHLTQPRCGDLVFTANDCCRGHGC
jgi:hypothetical protein